MPNCHYFRTSRKTVEVITGTFNFIKPTAVALWNMRWQYKGYLLENPTATQNEINHRFVEGCKIRGANIKASCSDSSWDDQLQWFSQILLIQLCAIFESWIDEILTTLQENNSRRRSSIAKKLQFPDKYLDGLNQLLTVKSGFQNVFYDGLKKHKKNNSAHVYELLLCYRYFKECRNSIVHFGGLANSNLIQLESQILQLAPSSLKLQRIPDIKIIAPDKKIMFDFRGIEIFAEIIIQLITTYDAELSQSQNAEDEFLGLWGEVHGEKKLSRDDHSKRMKQVMNCLNAIKLPVPLDIQSLINYLESKNCVSY